MSGETDAALIAVSELGREYANALGTVGTCAHNAARSHYEARINARQLVHDRAALAEVIRKAVNEWADQYGSPAQTG